MGVGTSSRKGIPALAGLRGELGTWIEGKTSTSSRGFPNALAGYLGGSRSPVAATLCGCADARFVDVIPSTSMVARMRGLWVFPQARRWLRGCADYGCFPGRGWWNDLMCLDWYYCIRLVLIPLLRRHSPYPEYIECIWIDIMVIRPVLVPLLRRHSPHIWRIVCVFALILFYKTGTSTNTQEVLSRALGA